LSIPKRRKTRDEFGDIWIPKLVELIKASAHAAYENERFLTSANVLYFRSAFQDLDAMARLCEGNRRCEAREPTANHDNMLEWYQ
jgi:hypothetical protein